jgi:hypothetical protein
MFDITVACRCFVEREQRDLWGWAQQVQARRCVILMLVGAEAGTKWLPSGAADTAVRQATYQAVHELGKRVHDEGLHRPAFVVGSGGVGTLRPPQVAGHLALSSCSRSCREQAESMHAVRCIVITDKLQNNATPQSLITTIGTEVVVVTQPRR